MTVQLSASSMPVEIVLDLRQLNDPPESGSDFLKLWSALTPALQGRALAAGGAWSLQNPEHGRIGFTIISVPSGERVVGPGTSFAVHSVLEAPVIRHTCSVCAGARQRTYGPFLCAHCREEEEKQTRLCDEHVIILDGAMTSFCPRHRPKAANGEWATFWCSGPQCRRKHAAWPDADRRRHPQEPSIWYCGGCYVDLFPPCSGPACTAIGSNVCEHVDPRTQRPCGSRLCNRHVRLWRIYGLKTRGLSFCRLHPAIKTLTAEQIIYQILAGTVLRRSRLPFLSKVRFTLQKAHGRIYELQSIYDLFARVIRNSSSADIAQLARNSEADWKREIAGGEDKRKEGLRYFEKLKAELISIGLPQVATGLVYSDYIANNKWLFVRLDDSLRGLMIGRGGATIKPIQDRLGVSIKFEKLSRV